MSVGGATVALAGALFQNDTMTWTGIVTYGICKTVNIASRRLASISEQTQNDTGL